jgi:hypothetical protein
MNNYLDKEFYNDFFSADTIGTKEQKEKEEIDILAYTNTLFFDLSRALKYEKMLDLDE